MAYSLLFANSKQYQTDYNAKVSDIVCLLLPNWPNRNRPNLALRYIYMATAKLQVHDTGANWSVLHAYRIAHKNYDTE